MKVFKSGGNLTICLPKSVCAKLSIDSGTELDYKIESGKLILTNSTRIIKLAKYPTNTEEFAISEEAFKQLELDAIRADEDFEISKKLQNLNRTSSYIVNCCLFCGKKISNSTDFCSESCKQKFESYE